MLSSYKGELKAQGAEEASRDPNSSVTAADAERVMIEESQKAGAAAFKFDPNASPEEKAAQAAASQNETGLHHRPKGVGIVSDMTEGPDDYDMPPPTTSGAIDATNSAVESSRPADGTLTEEEQWKKIGGHPPRFGPGHAQDIPEEPSLLEHQTLLEANLDDKFFGDWYHNAGIIIFASITSWLISELGGGLGWLFIVMAISSTYYRTSIRRVRRNFRDDITRELAKARLENDTESLEWMNSFLVKFWPIYAPGLAKSIVQSVDQILSTATPAFLDSMRMETFVLGSKPPRMEHVKTYPRIEDDIVMMDWRFSFTPTDTLDMTERQLKYKINPKVVLEIRLGKALVSKAMKIIVEDFAFSGLMRIKMKLQLEFPHIERIDMSFLERPEIDYVCKPLGGDTFGFDINFIPGLEGFIKEQIHANLGPMMYAPNVFPIEVAKLLSGNPIDLAIGVVAVTLHGANGLKNPDKFAGTPDPYAVLSLNGRTEMGRTKTIQENASPRWNETLYAIICNYTDALTIQVYDFNEFRKDKELGSATFALDKLEQQNEHENLQLEVIASGRPRGVIQADIKFFPVIEPRKAADGTALPVLESNTGVARLTVEQAKDLDGTKSLVGALNPYAVLLLNGKEVHITSKLKRTNNPVFSVNPSISVLVTDRKKARIGVVLKDDRDLAKDPIIGKYQIKLDDMLKFMEKGQQWFQLDGTKTGRVKLAVDWKPVALRGVTGGSGGYVTPIGVMRVHLKAATDVRNVETLSKSDPYGRVMLSGIQKGRTVTFRNNLNPVWDEVLYVPVHSPTERITLEVMDEEKIAKDRSLGLIEIPLAEYIKEAEDGTYTASGRKDLVDGLRMNGQGPAKGKLDYSLAFYPTLDVIDPDEEAEEKAAEEEEANAANSSVPATPIASNGQLHARKNSTAGKVSMDNVRPLAESRKSLEAVGRLENGSLRKPSLAGSSVNGSAVGKPSRPKIRVTADDLSKYECGLLIFNVIEGNFAHPECHLEMLMDDQAFPAYSSSRARQRQHKFGETGDAFVRELEYSKITLRLVEKVSKSGDDSEEHVIAKLVGQTLTTLQQCLYQPTQLTIKGNNGMTSTVTVKLKYLPVQMHLDPSESINNSGTLRVEVLDAADLPAADRNGYSDPYCKFKLNGKDIYKTKTQKKTLHPAWNEFFETPVASRTAAQFRCDVYDWDFGDKADFLGATDINLGVLEPFVPQELTYVLDGKSGVLRLKMLFKPSYVTRARQGSSTLSGTFAPAGKVVGAPVKGVTKVGGGVIKGASFLKRGLTGRGHNKDGSDPVSMNNDVTATGIETPTRQSTTHNEGLATVVSEPMTPQSTNNRHSRAGSAFGSPGPATADVGTANFNVVSAQGYPSGADVRVYIKMIGPRGSKELYKTKAIKSATGTVDYDPHQDNFKIDCSADTQFQVVVKDHGTFSSKDLGEGIFFVSDQGSGAEQVVKAGTGTVTLRTAFAKKETNGYAESIRPGTGGGDDRQKESRRSLFSRRDVSAKHEER